MPELPPIPDGQRRIFLGKDGAYPEAAPGAGPRHHDDMAADPAAMMAPEAKQLEQDLAALELAAPRRDRQTRGVMRAVIARVDGSHRYALVGIFAEHDASMLAQATAFGGVVVELPIVPGMDFRP